MKPGVGLIGLLVLGGAWSAAAATPESAATRGHLSQIEQNLEVSLQDQAPKVLCSYLLYGSKQLLCGPPPLENVQKKCDAKASKERGEETTCQCSDDPAYIGNACD